MIDERMVRSAKRPWSTTADRSARIRVRDSEPRTCIEPGCGVRMSAYNHSEKCWLHSTADFPTPPRGRASKQAA